MFCRYFSSIKAGWACDYAKMAGGGDSFDKGLFVGLAAAAAAAGMTTAAYLATKKALELYKLQDSLKTLVGDMLIRGGLREHIDGSAVADAVS